MKANADYYVADFETTLKPPVSVWLWCIVGKDYIAHGSNIESFLYHIFNNKRFKNKVIYFHNLKFDGMFLLYAFHRNNIEFDCTVTNTGVWYGIDVEYNNNKIIFKDSLKIFNMSVAKLPIAYDIDAYSKLDIDYSDYSYRQDALLYIETDCQIVYQALEKKHSIGDWKDTLASNAMAYYRSITPKFRFWFPKIDRITTANIKTAYYGGYTYNFNGGIHGEGCVYDVNSMYPAVMLNELLPYGNCITSIEPIDGMLSIIEFACDYKLKPGHLPTMPYIKKGFSHHYSIESQGIEYRRLTNIDLQHFFHNYDVYEFEITKSYNFNAQKGMFDNYILPLQEQKINAKNNFERTEAKLKLNSLYGKFGTSPIFVRKRVDYDVENDRLLFLNQEPEESNYVYMPMAVFITAFSRNILFNAVYNCIDRFLYCDTDSIHLSGTEQPDIPIHESEFGKWKLEKYFTRAKYIHSKCYIEERPSGQLDIVVAGLKDIQHKYVTFDNFEIGMKYPGKLKAKHVQGGIALVEDDYTIRVT